MLYCKGNLRPHYSGWSSFLLLVSASCCVFSVVLNASFPLQTSRFELFLASLALEFQLLLSFDFFSVLFSDSFPCQSCIHTLWEGILPSCFITIQYTLSLLGFSSHAWPPWRPVAFLVSSLYLTRLGQAPTPRPESCSQGCRIYFTKVENLFKRTCFRTPCSWREGRHQVSKTPLQYFPWCLKLNSDIKVTDQILW